MKEPNPPGCPLCSGPTVLYAKRIVNPLTRVFEADRPQPDETVYIYRCKCGTDFCVSVKGEVSNIAEKIPA